MGYGLIAGIGSYCILEGTYWILYMVFGIPFPTDKEEEDNTINKLTNEDGDEDDGKETDNEEEVLSDTDNGDSKSNDDKDEDNLEIVPGGENENNTYDKKTHLSGPWICKQITQTHTNTNTNKQTNKQTNVQVET